MDPSSPSSPAEAAPAPRDRPAGGAIVRVPRCARKVRLPVWAALLIGLWILLGAGAVWIRDARGIPGTTCLFRNATGQPCPTCGATRTTLALAEGRWRDALAINPLASAGLLFAAAWLFLRLGLGRRLEVRLAARGRRWAWLGTGLLFGLNWVYLLHTH